MDLHYHLFWNKCINIWMRHENKPKFLINKPRHESFPNTPPAHNCLLVRTTFCWRYTLLHWLSETPSTSTRNLILLLEAIEKKNRKEKNIKNFRTKLVETQVWKNQLSWEYVWYISKTFSTSMRLKRVFTSLK